jgi:hypothetical protein
MATQQTQQDDAQELLTLRQAHSEVLAKSSARKAKVKDLEIEIGTLKQQLADARQATLKITVRQPLESAQQSLAMYQSC